jgi:DNA polymerase zeta
MQVFENEMELINFVIDEVQDLDPDILVGWEVQDTSWGYFLKRAMSYGIFLDTCSNYF